jgi:hypothetical protein
LNHSAFETAVHEEPRGLTIPRSLLLREDEVIQ